MALEEHPVIFQDQSILQGHPGVYQRGGTESMSECVKCRKIAKEIVAGEQITSEMSPEIVEKFLGPRKFFYQVTDPKTISVWLPDLPGRTGGDIIFVEASRMKGKKELTLTGQVSDHADNHCSAQPVAAMQTTRVSTRIFYDTSKSTFTSLLALYLKTVISAGITMCMALISLLTGEYAGPKLRSR